MQHFDERANRLGSWIAKHAVWILMGWLVVTTVLRMVAPSWDDIAADGDIAFLPKTLPSAIGKQALDRAFPGTSSQSQLVVVLATPDQQLQSGDIALGLDLARHLHWMAAHAAYRELPTFSPQISVSAETDSARIKSAREETLFETAMDNIEQVIAIEEALSKYTASLSPKGTLRSLPDTFYLRSQLHARSGNAEQSQKDSATSELNKQRPELKLELENWSLPIRDVWSWRSAVVGHKLGAQHANARLIAVQLSTEVTATKNIDVLNNVEDLVRELRARHQGQLSTNLKTEVSGSAAIGADMLRAAASGVRKTEIVTVVLVLLILISVYRSPLLVAIPLISITLSLLVSLSVIALIARDPTDETSWGIGVFTTTRIFIVVLLFGAGTDFCLFYLARCRELLTTPNNLETKKFDQSRGNFSEIVGAGWASVHQALIASACTTIIGLALMWFSEFEKFQFSGPIIAICLAVTLLVCLTFTPALLACLGWVAFWPQIRKSGANAAAKQTNEKLSSETHSLDEKAVAKQTEHTATYWAYVARWIVQRPALALFVTLAFLCVPASYGLLCRQRITYDLTEELSHSAPSRRGARLISNYFPLRDGSPITVIIEREEPFADEAEMQTSCQALSQELYVDGVSSVRSISDPLGDYPPGKRMGLFDQDAWRRRLLKSHRITRERYVSQLPVFERRVARFDVMLEASPFSQSAADILSRVQQRLHTRIEDPKSTWYASQVAYTGTTVGISDLRTITQADQTRIQVLVTFGVWLVLILVLRRPILSTYLIATVLLSYFATLGITYFLFSSLYAGDYSGLDWKVPIFLFVILVAVGQDYNVYLVTRIFEERQHRDLKNAVATAVHRTGGIITSCGFVMAGTFVAMTSPAVLSALATILPEGWIDNSAPVLRGITELGFALSFGVLLDTLVVRSILVPSFVVLMGDRSQASVDISSEQ